jgi:hypothetical protein
MNNDSFVSAMNASRPREKTDSFNVLLKVVGDTNLADIIWIYWGERSLDVLNDPMQALNPKCAWWEFFKPKKTIRSLLGTGKGREQIWEMLHSASAWL